jgi:hypothetical protein
MIKLLTLIEEERKRRKLKCRSDTSYHFCFVWNQAASFSQTCHRAPHVHGKGNQTSTQPSHLPPRKNRVRGLVGVSWYIGKGGFSSRGTFSTGSCHERVLKIPHEPVLELWWSPATSWSHGPMLMPPLVWVHSTTDDNALQSQNPKPCFPLVYRDMVKYLDWMF